ncbi:MAG: aminodeoxychorismate synthase component I [Hyphomonadaceae bacterium]|nr:aminodeoxychorismate synthase component I [Hyphomonadaceae bacterium]
MTSHYVYFEDQLVKGGPWQRRLYINPTEIIAAWTPQEVEPALQRLQALREDGLYLAGHFSYELGYLLEDALTPLLPENRDTPLLQFGAFRSFERSELQSHGTASIGWMTPDWTKSEYKKKFEQVAAYIQAGDVYQINLTFPLRGRAEGSAAALYGFLKKRQPVQYGGVIQLSDTPIITLSPELFYEQDGQHIKMRPMKGTIKRGATESEDVALANELQHDIKNRAENLMIVDLLRNDLSRISEPGSVKVDDLFSIETYPSLHTMTSGIEAKLKPDTELKQLLHALFPCGSVTGAPKIRAMEIIRELETVPRGAYCGAIGMIDPDGKSRFNVGIRTLSLSADGSLSYPVGSGVVADSTGAAEYEECLLKAAFLTGGSFELIETIGWDPKIGFMHLDLHLERLAASAFVFGYAFRKSRVRQELDKAVSLLNGPHKIRMTLAHNGEVNTSATPLKLSGMDTPWPVSLSKNRLNSRDRMLRHKTTQRQFYDGERERVSKLTGCQEVLFFNQRDELCEGSFTNVFIKKDGKMLTPALRSGLLPGVLRKTLLANNDVKAKTLTRDDLLSADAIYVGNSVRGLVPAQLIDSEEH